MALLAETAAFLADQERASELYDLLAPYASLVAAAPHFFPMGAMSRYLGMLAGRAVASRRGRAPAAGRRRDERRNRRAAMGRARKGRPRPRAPDAAGAGRPRARRRSPTRGTRDPRATRHDRVGQTGSPRSWPRLLLRRRLRLGARRPATWSIVGPRFRFSLRVGGERRVDGDAAGAEVDEGDEARGCGSRSCGG